MAELIFYLFGFICGCLFVMLVTDYVGNKLRDILSSKSSSEEDKTSEYGDNADWWKKHKKDEDE